MEQEKIRSVLNITNLDNNDGTIKLDKCELDVSKEIISELKFLVKSVTEENGDVFSLQMPKGLSEAFSKLKVTSLGVGTPWAGIMSLISVVACKLFLGIQSQLEDINSKLSEIIDFLVTDKLCELESQFKFLQFSYNNYEYIVTNEGERFATIVQIQATKKVALQNVLFYERYLSRHLHKTSNSKSALIEEANTFLENAENYRYSAELYCISLIMELIFSQNYNKNLISNVKKEISEMIKNVNKNLGESVGAMKKVLDSKTYYKDSENEIIEKNQNYSDMGKREDEYRKNLDQLYNQVN